MKKNIFIAIFLIFSFSAFAMAGFAERWLEAWVNSMFLALTVAAIHAIVICFLIFFRKQISQANVMKIYKYLMNRNFASTIIGGLLLSFIIATYIDFACGAFFIFGGFMFLVVWLIQWLLAFIPASRKKITAPKAIFNLSCLSLGTPIGYILYFYIVRYRLFQSLYSYSYTDTSMPEVEFTIHPTRFHPSSVTNLLVYTIILFFPWIIKLLCMSIRIIYLRFRSRQEYIYDKNYRA